VTKGSYRHSFSPDSRPTPLRATILTVPTSTQFTIRCFTDYYVYLCVCVLTMEGGATRGDL